MPASGAAGNADRRGTTRVSERGAVQEKLDGLYNSIYVAIVFDSPRVSAPNTPKVMSFSMALCSLLAAS